MQETTKNETVDGAVEVNSVKDAEHAGKQKLLIDQIGTTWKREESDRIAGWYSLSRMAAEYVGNDLAYHGNGVKSYSASVQKLTAYLSDMTDDAKASVSRLLATDGLCRLMRTWYVDNFSEDEADELTNENMNGLTVSLLKSLVRLIERDAETPEGLVYVWKAEALDKGPTAVSDCYGDGWTVSVCKDKVDAILVPVTEETEEDSATSKRKNASQKGTKAIDTALSTAGKNGARKDTLKRAVKTEALTHEDIATILSAVQPDDIAKVIGVLVDAKRFALVGAIYRATRDATAKLKAEKEQTAEPVAA